MRSNENLGERRGTVGRRRGYASEIDSHGLDLLFRRARSQNGWTSEPVSELLLMRVYDLAKMGPTSMNSCPMRAVFVTSAERKEAMLPAINEGNREKIRNAPAVAIIAYDLDFPDMLPTLFPHRDIRETFERDPALTADTAYRNGTLQGAYLMLAARSLGLDCGPISGFDRDRMDQLFFPDTRIRTNFLCGLGYGDKRKIFSRLPRPRFDAVCRLE